ncbi:MAG: hypothetical protein ACK4M3_01830 [Pyrobaculum sp.]
MRKTVERADCGELLEAARRFDIPLTPVRRLEEVYREGLVHVSNFFKRPSLS